MTTAKVFVSHCAKDRQEVDELVAYLEARNVPVWIAPRDIRPGINYAEQTQDAIEQCGAFVVVITEAANDSFFVRAETEMAFSNRRLIFPVRFGAIDPVKGLGLFLNIHHWTDVFGPSKAGNLERLASELRALPGLAAAAPPAMQPVPPPPLMVAEAPPPTPMPAAAAKPRRAFVMPPRAAIAAGVAGLLTLAILPLAANRSPTVPPATQTDTRTPAEIAPAGKAASENIRTSRPVLASDPVPPARKAVTPSRTGAETSRPTRAAAPAAANARQTPRPAVTTRRIPAQRTVPVRSQQMPCRQMAVGDKPGESRRACARPGGMIDFG